MLVVGFGDLGVNAHVGLALDLGGAAHAVLEHAEYKYQEHPDHEAGRDAANKDVELFRLALDGLDLRRVHNAHVAHLARTHHAQLLDVVEHGGVNLVVHLHFLLQAHHLLLRERHFLGAALELGKFTAELVLLLFDGLHRGVFLFEQARRLLALLLQGDNLALQVDLFVQVGAGLARHVDRANAVAVVGKHLLGTVEFCLDPGQLLFQKFQCLLGLGAAHFHVLAHIGVEHRVQNARRTVGVAVRIRDCDYTRLLTLFGSLNGLR